MIHAPSGRYVMLGSTIDNLSALDLRNAAASMGVDEAETVIVHGTADQVETLATSVRLGAAERERRAKRRKQQAQSRRRNR